MKNTYRTEQRKLIIDYLISNHNKFVNAEEIMNYMKKNNQPVGLTTIYRFLNMLEKDNKVRTDIKEHTKFYQYVMQNDSHGLFLKCKSCGKSMNLDCKEIEEINEHIKNEHNFKLDTNTIIYGICDKCI